MGKLENYTTATYEGYTFHVTKSGFPVVDCTRCGGGGYFGPIGVEGGQCFDCRTAGVVVPGSGSRSHNIVGASEIFAEYRAAVRSARQTIVCRLNPGDQVRPSGNDVEYKTVDRIEKTDQTCGSSLIGIDESKRTYSYYYLVFFEGETEPERLAENVLYQRKAKPVDPAPYAARAQAAYVDRLRRHRIKPNAEQFAADVKARQEREAAEAEAAAEAKADAEAKARRDATALAREAILKLADAAQLVKEFDPAAYTALGDAMKAAAEGLAAAHRPEK